MKKSFVFCLLASLLSCVCAQSLFAEAPQTADVMVNGQKIDLAETLAADKWHTMTARYQYASDLNLLTNTYLVIAVGDKPLSGLYIGYHLPTHQLAIVKHGFWNATEATGLLGESGKIIENDQAYLDCENTKVEKTANTIAVNYRLKFKKHALKGAHSVLLYVEDAKGNHHGFNNVGTVAIDKEAVYRTDMPRQWENTLKPTGKAAASVVLANNGKAEYILVIPKDAKEIEKKAAHDIALYFKMISGAEFPIVEEDAVTDQGRPLVSIGRTQLLEQSPSDWKSADLAAEGYAIEVIGKNVYLYGGRGRGLMHGVYSLLEEDMGCRWYSTNSIDTPHMEKFSVRLASRKFVPVLELRYPYIRKLFHESNWSLANKTNAPLAPIPLAWGGSIRYHHMGHTSSIYFPTEQYFAKHPEYYALVNGKRQPSQLCNTNEDVIRLSIEKTCKIFRDNPDVTITAIGPNDSRGFCDCPSCKKLDDENGGRAGSFFYHVNRIAEGVKKEFPNHHLISLAYLDYAQPPTKLKVDPYIIIQLCTDSHAWMYQFCNVWESEGFQKMIKGWHAANAKLFIWDYTTNYVHCLVPMANWPVIAENTRFNIKNGAAGIMYECAANDNDEMRGWVYAKLLWNPDLDTKTLLKDFVFGYYKESAQPLWDYEMMMWDFWEKWHKVPHKCGAPSDNPLLNNLHCSYAPDGPMFTPDFMTKMRECFTRAEGMAKSEDILARVKKAKISLLYLELSQQLGYYTEFGDFTYGKSMRESHAKRSAFKQYLDEFVDLCKKNAITTFGIPITFEKITDKWQSCIDMEGSSLSHVDLPAEWIFTTDPEDKGVGENWYTNQTFYDAAVRKTNEFAGGTASTGALEKGLARLSINRGIGWEQQGFPRFDGYGWYFQNIEIPDELFAKPHLYLHFLRVNEQAWVYVNGEFAFERTYASTGKSVGNLWTAAFSADIKKYLKPGIKNRIAVRVTHSSGLGGILMPIVVIGTEEQCTTEQLKKYRR